MSDGAFLEGFAEWLPCNGVEGAFIPCGIAAGARDTMKSVLNYIENEKVSGVSVTQTGCIGLCEQEPIMQVVLGDQPKVVYGKVNAQVAEKIMKQHVQNGQPVKENIIQI